MATITSSILALLAAAPEPSEVETVPNPEIVSPSTLDPSGSGAPFPPPTATTTPESLDQDETAPVAQPDGTSDHAEAATEDDDAYQGGLADGRLEPPDTVDGQDIAGTSAPTAWPPAV